MIVSPRLETVSSSSSTGLHEPLEDFDQIEQELHCLFAAAKREALGRDLSPFDQDAPQIEVDGEGYDRALRCETTYNSAVGPVRVERSLYRHPLSTLTATI